MHPLTTDGGDASAALNELAERFWEDVLRANPRWATQLGDRRFDDRLSDVSPEAIVALSGARRATAEAARAIPEAGLSARERVTRQMLIDEAESQAVSYDPDAELWSVDPLNGPATTMPEIPEFQPIGTPEDAGRMAARWRAVGPYMDQLAENLRIALGQGRVAVRTPIERVIDIVRTIEAAEAAQPAGGPFAAPAAALPEDWPAAERDRRAGEIRAAAEEAVAAFGRYRDVLEREILPSARSDEQPGLVHLPGGEAIYRSAIRVHTTLDLDPREIHETGLAEIARIDAEFVALGRRVLGTPDLASTLDALRADPTLRFSTSEEVFEVAERSLRRAEAAVPGWFGRVPKAPCEVVRIAPHAAPHQTIAYYSWPAMDGSRPGRYYINLYAPETRPRYEAEALAFHEAVPGHHLQIAIAQELEGLPAFQRMLGSTAFAEGWGLYTERLSDEMGLYSGDLDRFGILSYDAWRAGRLVVDTGMHALGWSRTRAIDFLFEHSALARNNIENEVDRYIVWPGQALAYKIGQLEILRLRDDARTRLGRRFDIRAFHDAVLGSGAVSLTALAGIVEAWIAETEGAAARA